MDAAKPFAHAPFIIETIPISHDFCGDLTLTPKFNGEEIGSDDSPLSYEETSDGTGFTVYTVDHNYFNTTVPYQLAAELTLYRKEFNPGADSKESSSVIFFDYPCTNLFLFEPTDQDDLESDKYTGDPKSFEMTKFQLEPAFCIDGITYDLTSITGPDGNEYKDALV